MKFNTAEEAIDYLHQVTKQQEIREGIARRLRLYRLNEVEGQGDDCIAPWDECDANTKGHWLSDADDWLKYLDSLGLVVRKDGELPKFFCNYGHLAEVRSGDGCIVVVEPLIGEKREDKGRD